MRDGNVYFIRDGCGNIKIGVAQDVLRRMKELQTSNPNKLEIVSCLHLPRLDHAYMVETELHKKFSNVRKQGEWFDENEVKSWLDGEDLQVLCYKFV